MSSLSEPGIRRPFRDRVSGFKRTAHDIAQKARPLAARVWTLLLPPPPPILPPYVRRRGGVIPALLRTAGLGLVVWFCYLYGQAFAMLGQWIILLMLVPLVILALTVIWALPATDRVPIRLITALFMMSFVAPAIWPEYLGYRPPGLPWLTLARVIIAPLALLFLISVSTSQTFRTAMRRTLSADWTTSGFAIGYMLMAVASVFWSVYASSTAESMIDFFLYFTLPFFAACAIFQRRGGITFWVRLLWGTAVFVSLIAIVEAHYQHVPWAGHIPAFLTIQDPAVQLSLMGFKRLWAEGYRAESTIGNPMVCGEYLALALPFIIHSMFNEQKRVGRIAAIVSVPVVVLAIFDTHARSGMGGAFTGVLLYALYWGMTKWRADRSSLLGPAVVASYPVMALCAGLAVLFVGRLRRMIIGSGGTASSNDARVTQWHSGWGAIMHRPWGYGWSTGADVVGFHSPGGLLTIDSWILSTLVELGFFGLFVFLTLWLRAIYKTGLIALTTRTDTSDDHELHFIAPVAVSLAAWLEIRTVLSELGNFGNAFVILAMGLALMSRIKAAAAAPARHAPVEAPGPKWRMVGALGMPGPGAVRPR